MFSFTKLKNIGKDIELFLELVNKLSTDRKYVNAIPETE